MVFVKFTRSNSWTDEEVVWWDYADNEDAANVKVEAATAEKDAWNNERNNTGGRSARFISSDIFTVEDLSWRSMEEFKDMSFVIFKKLMSLVEVD